MSVSSNLPFRDGPSFFVWNTAGTLSNISQIPDMIIGDYVVNGSGAARTILGLTISVGGVVKSITETTGEGAGNIVTGHAVNTPSSYGGGSASLFGHVGMRSDAPLMDGAASWSVNNYGNSSYAAASDHRHPTDTTRISTWITTDSTAISNISQVSGMIVGDIIINEYTAAKTILGQTCYPGQGVKSTSATAGILMDGVGPHTNATPANIGPASNAQYGHAILSSSHDMISGIYVSETRAKAKYMAYQSNYTFNIDTLYIDGEYSGDFSSATGTFPTNSTKRYLHLQVLSSQKSGANSSGTVQRLTGADVVNNPSARVRTWERQNYGGTWSPWLEVGQFVTSGQTDYATARVRNIYAGTSDMTPGSTALASGDIYIMYE
jgi:hypothetical protein